MEDFISWPQVLGVAILLGFVQLAWAAVAGGLSLSALLFALMLSSLKRDRKVAHICILSMQRNYTL